MAHSTSNPAGDSARRPRSSFLIVGILAGVTAVVLLAGGVGIWAVWRRAPAAPAATQVAGPLSPESEEGGGEASPTVKTRKVALTSAAPAAGGPTRSQLAGQEKLLKSISSWHSMAGVRSFGVSSANLQVTRVWRTDAAGSDNKEGKRYVCVEVTISNKSRAPLRYKGWNAYDENGAILADENHEVLPLVPVEKTPELARLTATSVPGGGSVKEVLVFAAPAAEDEVLHLVLPYSVFYSNVRPPHRALELTPDLMGVDLAEASPRSAAGAAAPSSQPAAELEPVPAAADKTTDTSKKSDKPPSLRDMINNDPAPPARPDDMPVKGDKGEKPADKKGEAEKKGKDSGKPENPFELKGDNPLDPLSVVPKGEETDKEP